MRQNYWYNSLGQVNITVKHPVNNHTLCIAAITIFLLLSHTCTILFSLL